jgi:CheY-like chemotaxis protein
LLGNGDLLTTAVRTAAEALAAIRTEQYDCLVLDLGLPDMPGTELLNQIRSSPQAGRLPVIIYAAREAFGEEASTLEGVAESILLKDSHGPERLLDETAILLHRKVASLPARQRLILEAMHQGALDGKKVLVVDDDVKNIFALTSLLERLNMQVVAAENGQDALQLVSEHPDFDAVLTEITLPIMDGYSTMRMMRELPALKELPIIAVTAKAMKGDREKCLAAGASDYICKPVDAEQLRATLCLWLHR